MRRLDLSSILALFGLLFCGLALMHPRLRLPFAPPKIAFLIDGSSSFSWARRRIINLLIRKVASLPENAQIDIYLFGNGSYRVSSSTASRFTPSLPSFKADASRTGFLNLDRYNQVWLFTDGYSDINVKCRRLNAVILPPPFDSSITDVDLTPPSPGAATKLTVTVASSHPTESTLILKAGKMCRRVSLRTTPRGRTVSFMLKAGTPLDVKVSVETEGDANPTNDSVSFTLLGGDKKIVGYVGRGGATVEALKKAGFWVEEVKAGELEKRLKFLDALVLEDVAWEDLPAWTWRKIEESCRSGAIGVVVMGAECAFGMGGYQGRLIEEMLPLNSRPKESRPTALFVVLDGSGSMGERVGVVTKWRSALAALGAMLRRLSRGDALGVVVFDTQAHTIKPLAAWDETETFPLLEKLALLTPSGGTNIWRGIAAALTPLTPKMHAKKAILLLTDGHTQGKPSPQNFNSQLLKRHHISIHAVALGKNPNIDLLQFITSKTGGTLHRARFLSEELERALKGALGSLKELLRRGDFRVEGMGPKRIFFYVRTAAKKDAEVLGRVEGGPLIARWRYGGGGVVAVATSSSGGLAEWNAFSAFLAEQINWTTNAHTWAKAFYDGESLCVRVGGLPEDVTEGSIWMDGVWRKAVAVNFGVLEAHFEGIKEVGPVVVKVGKRRWRAGPVFVGPEREVGVDVGRIRRLVEAHNGTVFDQTEFISAKEEQGEGVVPIWRWFVLLGLGLLFVSVALSVLRSRRL